MLFTILIFLLPTTALYYLVFTLVSPVPPTLGPTELSLVSVGASHIGHCSELYVLVLKQLGGPVLGMAGYRGGQDPQWVDEIIEEPSFSAEHQGGQYEISDTQVAQALQVSISVRNVDAQYLLGRGASCPAASPLVSLGWSLSFPRVPDPLVTLSEYSSRVYRTTLLLVCLMCGFSPS